MADALARLDAGLALSMPLSRPLPNVGPGVHELRLSAPSGAYRVVYAIVKSGMVRVLHAFKKTAQQIPARNLRLARRRLRETR